MLDFTTIDTSYCFYCIYKLVAGTCWALFLLMLLILLPSIGKFPVNFLLTIIVGSKNYLTRSFIRLSSAMHSNSMYFHYSVTASSYCFVLALAAMTSSGILLLWHTYLSFTNQVSGNCEA